MTKSLLLVFFVIVSCASVPLNEGGKAISNSNFRRSDCNIQWIGLDIISNSAQNIISDSVYMEYNQKSSGTNSKVFDIYNTTKDTVYLYSGLFNSDWIKQPYVHQYNRYIKSYVFSLTPLYKNFKEIFEVNTFLDVHYNWYSFIALKPNQCYRLKTYIGANYFEKEQNAIKAIHPQAAYEALKSPFLNLKDQSVQSATIRVGIYNDIHTLCEDKYFTQDELTGLQMHFTTISTNFLFWGK